MLISPCLFILVDLQHDFFDQKGKMYIKGAEEIGVNVKRLLKHAVKKGWKLITAVETYKDDPENTKQYCIAGTKGQKLIPQAALKKKFILPCTRAKYDYEALFAKYDQLIIEKHDFDIFTNPHALKLLKKSRIKNCVVFGLGIDYGMERMILVLLENGFKVWVPVDAVKPINEGNREPVLKELRSKGAEMWNTDFIIEKT